MTPTRYYLDCEFIDDGKTVDLISIGVEKPSAEETE